MTCGKGYQERTPLVRKRTACSAEIRFAIGQQKNGFERNVFKRD
jgi:hypothetical protein